MTHNCEQGMTVRMSVESGSSVGKRNQPFSSVVKTLLQTILREDVPAKSVDKMADIETFTLRISINSSQMCNYFFKDLVTGYRLYLVKIGFPTVIRFENAFITHTLLLRV